jgi:hypothetical protein
MILSAWCCCRLSIWLRLGKTERKYLWNL